MPDRPDNHCHNGDNADCNATYTPKRAYRAGARRPSPDTYRQKGPMPIVCEVPICNRPFPSIRLFFSRIFERQGRDRPSRQAIALQVHRIGRLRRRAGRRNTIHQSDALRHMGRIDLQPSLRALLRLISRSGCITLRCILHSCTCGRKTQKGSQHQFYTFLHNRVFFGSLLQFCKDNYFLKKIQMHTPCFSSRMCTNQTLHRKQLLCNVNLSSYLARRISPPQQLDDTTLPQRFGLRHVARSVA